MKRKFVIYSQGQHYMSQYPTITDLMIKYRKQRLHPLPSLSDEILSNRSTLPRSRSKVLSICSGFLSKITANLLNILLNKSSRYYGIGRVIRIATDKFP